MLRHEILQFYPRHALSQRRAGSIAVRRTEETVDGEDGVDYCNRLFAIERGLKEKSAQERYAGREKQSGPVLDAFLTWLQEQSGQVLPKSTLGKTITYCLNQWDKLITFLEDGNLELDNNRAERSVKPFVSGRKCWLFSNTPRGATASALTYDPNAVASLLPWSTELPEGLRQRKGRA